MSPAELLRIAWRSLRAHALRSFLTTLGVVIAVWTIVSVLSVISGMNNFVLTRIFTLSPDVFVVTQFGIITSFEEFLEAVKRKPISDWEATKLRELCESCAEVGQSLGGSRPVHAGRRRIDGVPLNGTTANVASLQNLDIEVGRYFTELENLHRAPVAVIGSEVREELFPRLDPVGRTIWVGGVPHRVIGALSRQGSFLGNNPDLVVFLPLRSAEKLVGRARNMDSQMTLLVRARGGVGDVSGCQGEVVQVFRWLRGTPIRGPDPVGAVTAEAVGKIWRSISLSTFVFVTIIAGISLVVGAIVVANIMLVSVIERTREIGLRLALGARRRDVRRQFLLESAALALAGGAIGTVAGVLTAWVVDTQSPFPAQVRLPIVAAALATALVTGILAGFFPARKAASLTPVEALRHE